MLQHPSAVLSLSLLTTTLSQFSHEINAQEVAGNTPLMVLLKRLYEGAFDKESTTNALRRKQPPGETREDESISVTEEFSPYLKLKPLVEYLITYPGADITIQNIDGDTALHIVCRYFHVGALEAMLCNVNSFEQAAKYCLIAFQLLDGMIYLFPSGDMTCAKGETRVLSFLCAIMPFLASER
jgi:hypothetical protein